jgi:hypothetical protein
VPARSPAYDLRVSHRPDALFQFEGDFQTDLRCIPMSVRHNLDLCGIKLSLREWVKLGPEQRAVILDAPAGTADELRRFAGVVDDIVTLRMGSPPKRCDIEAAPAWADRGNIPAEVAAKALAEGVELTPAQWSDLAPLQRFALYKLSRSSHKNDNFVPACREFGVLGGSAP